MQRRDMESKTESTKSSHKVRVVGDLGRVVGVGRWRGEGGEISEEGGLFDVDVGASSVKATELVGAVELREERQMPR